MIRVWSNIVNTVGFGEKKSKVCIGGTRVHWKGPPLAKLASPRSTDKKTNANALVDARDNGLASMSEALVPSGS